MPQRGGPSLKDVSAYSELSEMSEVFIMQVSPNEMHIADNITSGH